MRPTLLLTLAATLTLALTIALGRDVAYAAPPDNDDYPGTAIPALPFDATTSTEEATAQPGEPVSDCSFDEPLQNTVWYSYVAAADSAILADASESDFAAVLAVWTPSDFPGAALAPVACGGGIDFFTGEPLPARASFQAEAGRTYYIQAGGFFPPAFGMLVLSVTQPPPATNDLVADATPVPALPFSDSVITTGATTEAAEPEPPCLDLGGFTADIIATVWYAFTPPDDQLVMVSAAGSDFDTVIAVWSGTPGAFEPVVCNDEFFGSQSAAGFQAQAGQTYYVQAGGFSAPGFPVPGTGLLELSITTLATPDCSVVDFMRADPVADGFDLQRDLVGVSGGANGANYCLTLEFSAPIPPPGEQGDNPLFALIDINTDNNFDTGGPEFVKLLCEETEPRFAIELELYADSFTGAIGAIFDLSIFAPFGAPAELPFVTVLYGTRTLTMAVPMTALGDASFLLAGVVGGVQTIEDCVPNDGYVSTSGADYLFGDVNCDGVVNSLDGLAVLLYVANLPVSQEDGCPPIGSMPNGEDRFGDIDCNGLTGSVDALQLLLFVSHLPLNQGAGCTEIGQYPAAVSVAGAMPPGRQLPWLGKQQR